MRSIRLSLMVYLLGLLVLGLGGVSLLTYRTMASTLQDKEKQSRTLLEAEYFAQAHEFRVELDQNLLRKAKDVTARVGRPVRMPWLNSLGMLGSAALPMGHLHLGVNLHLSSPPFSWRLTPLPFRLLEMRTLDQIVNGGDDFYREDDTHPRDFCQTNFRNGQIWERTSSLGPEFFKLSPEARRADIMQEHYDDVDLGDRQLRRVSLKAPRGMFWTSPPGPGGGKFFRGPISPQAMHAMRALSEPYFFVQFATDTAPLRGRIAFLEAERDSRLARLTDETQNTLRDLRRRLFFLSTFTLLGLAIGGLVLVYLGLAPLQRLSEAVSDVSERDFRLKLDPRTLPGELQPIAERLSLTLDQLQRAFAREKQAAQNISHDLRTPLAALTTTLEVALRKDRTPAEYRDLLDECQVSARHMTHLVERLLALAKIDAGTNPLRPRVADVVHVVQHVADLVRPLAKARGISILLDTPETLLARFDPDKLGEALTNLMHNAVDYNQPEGTINLRVRVDAATLLIEVADTGIGIRPEARVHLFERFYRDDPSRHADTPHCGLGLAIVKSYVELMDGTIEVESEVGVGTTFRLRFPYAPVTSESAFQSIDIATLARQGEPA